jgi:hypothetical protein
LEAQKNIAETIKSVVGGWPLAVGNQLPIANSQPRISLIALEGSATPINLDKYRRFPDREAVRETADWLLKENKISGPVHALLTSPIPPFEKGGG